MVVLVKLLGIAIVASVVTFMVKPATMKKYVGFWTKGSRLYVGAVISFLIGVILLRAASQCSIGIIVTLIGIMSVAKGIALVAIDQKKLTSFMELLLKKPARELRLMFSISLAVGVLLIYAA